MKKAHKSYTLVFQILLLLCSGYAYAQAPGNVSTHPSESFNLSHQSLQKCGTALECSYQLPFEKGIVRICSEENEDSDSKITFDSTYTCDCRLYHFFNARKVNTLDGLLNNSVRCEHWLYSSSSRSVVLGVMRI